MRKILLSLILISGIIGSASAQVGKGNYYLGGSLNYNYDEAGTSAIYNYSTGTTYYNNGHITNFAVSPDFGFFLSKKWAVGIQLGFSTVSGTETSNFISSDNAADNKITIHDYHTDSFGIGIHFRYYWMLNDRIGIFPQFGVTTSNNTDNLNYGTLTIGGNPNIVFFATPRLGINLGFGNLAYTLDYKSKTSNFNFGLNTNIGFGLNYYWGK